MGCSSSSTVLNSHHVARHLNNPAFSRREGEKRRGEEGRRERRGEGRGFRHAVASIPLSLKKFKTAEKTSLMRRKGEKERAERKEIVSRHTLAQRAL